MQETDTYLQQQQLHNLHHQIQPSFHSSYHVILFEPSVS